MSTTSLELKRAITKKISLDLHGRSLREGQLLVHITIEKAQKNGIVEINIITGRGNHPNQDGRRGLILRAFPKWLENSKVKPLIQFVTKKLGSFVVRLKNDRSLSQTLFSSEESKKNQTLKRQKKLLAQQRAIKKEPILILTLLDPELKNKKEAIEQLLIRDKNTLTEFYDDGTSALMVAAAQNEIGIMTLLLSTNPNAGLLKQTRDDGFTVLMAAVEQGHVEATQYLLEKAPSLLRQKCKNDVSVFEIARNSKDPKALLEILHHHLKHHKREKGYTGLFQEYKKLTQPKNGKILILESEEMKKQRENHSWFFMDRMMNFLSELRKPIKQLQTIKLLINQAKEDYLKPSALRSILVKMLKTNTIVKHLFLRFNNAKKTKEARRHKHALVFKTLPVKPTEKIKTISAKGKISQKPLLPAYSSGKKPTSIKKPLIFSKSILTSIVDPVELKSGKKPRKKHKKNKR